MNGLGELWGWLLGGGVTVALVAMFAVAPGAAIGVLRELAGIALGLARGLLRWLREVRDWWRFASFALGAVCLVLGLTLAEARRETELVRAQCDTRLAAVQGQLSLAEDRTAGHAAALGTCQTTLAREVGRGADVEELASQAVRAAAAAAGQAEASRQAWEKTWNAKPANCQAALANLEAQCPTLRDY